MADQYLIAVKSSKLAQMRSLLDDVSGIITMPAATMTVNGNVITKEYVDLATAGLKNSQDLDDIKGNYFPEHTLGEFTADIADKATVTDLTALASDSVYLTGSTVTGAVQYDGLLVSDNQLVSKAFVEDAVVTGTAGGVSPTVGNATYVKKSGGTLTGALILRGAPSAALHVATKKYVDDTRDNPSAYISRAGGTVTGPVILNRIPINPWEAATKQYVDYVGSYYKAGVHQYVLSGAVQVILSPVWATRDSAGKMLAMPNRGAGGSKYDAAMMVNSVTVTNGMWKPDAVTNMLKIATPLEQPSMHYIWVLQDTGYTGFAGICDYKDGNGNTWCQTRTMSGNRLSMGLAMMHYYTGVEVQNNTARSTGPLAGTKYLFESVANTSESLNGFINGGGRGGMSTMAGQPPFKMDIIGGKYYAQLTRVPTIHGGSFGDFIAIDVTHADYTNARIAVRDWLATKHGITLVSNTANDIFEDPDPEP